MADDQDALDGLLRALRSDKDGLNEWNMSVIRMVVVISNRLKIAEDKLLEKADKREVWWIRFLLFSAIMFLGSLTVALIPGILSKKPG